KNSTASSTVISSTSEIDLPLYFISRVTRLYRLPSHTSHFTYTFGRKFISILFRPAPSHASHLPPFTLMENLPILYHLIFDSGSAANRSLMWVNNPVYVAGLLRGVRPMGDWSISMTLSSILSVLLANFFENPSIDLYGSGFSGDL